MGTETILRNLLLLEGKEYAPEQIASLLRNEPVSMRITDAIALNNRLQAINYITNIADKLTYAAALELCKLLGRDTEPYSDLRSLSILTKGGKIESLSRNDVINALQNKHNSPLKQAAYILKFFVEKLPFEHSNEAIGYLLACKVLIENGDHLSDFENKEVVSRALEDDDLLENILVKKDLGVTIEYNGNKYPVEDILTVVPPALREAYESDYECAQQFVAEYAKQIIL